MKFLFLTPKNGLKWTFLFKEKLQRKRLPGCLEFSELYFVTTQMKIGLTKNFELPIKSITIYQVSKKKLRGAY